MIRISPVSRHKLDGGVVDERPRPYADDEVDVSEGWVGNFVVEHHVCKPFAQKGDVRSIREPIIKAREESHGSRDVGDVVHRWRGLSVNLCIRPLPEVELRELKAFYQLTKVNDVPHRRSSGSMTHEDRQTTLGGRRKNIFLQTPEYSETKPGVVPWYLHSASTVLTK